MNSIWSRLNAVELAVSSGNMQFGYMIDGVNEILRRSQTAEDIVREMERLRTSLKELMKSFVLLSLGGEGLHDAEIP